MKKRAGKSLLCIQCLNILIIKARRGDNSCCNATSIEISLNNLSHMPLHIPNYQIRPRIKPYDRMPDPNDPITIMHYDPEKNDFSESLRIPMKVPIQMEHSGDDQEFAEQPPSIPADLEGPPFNAEAGPTDFEEDTYYDFRDGFDNPVAVQRIAKMVDMMTGLEVATRIVESWRHETLSDLRNDLDNGQPLGIKAEDLQETSCVLKELVSTIMKRDMKVKVGVTSSLHQLIFYNFLQAVSFSKVLASDCLRMGLDIETTPIPTTVANQKIMACLSNFFEFNLKLSNFSTNEFNNSTIPDLAASIALISCRVKDYVRLNVYPCPSKTNNKSCS